MRKLLGFLLVVGIMAVPQGAGAIVVCDATFPASIPNVDQRDALQAVIDAAPDGTTGDRTVICFPGKAKTYRVEGEIDLFSRHHLQILSNSNKFNRTAKWGDIDPSAKTEWVVQLDIQLSDDIVIDKLRTASVGDCTFDTNFEGESAVHIGGSTDVTLTGFVITGPPGDGYGITWKQEPGSQAAGVPSERVNISGGSVTCTGRQGVGVTSSTYDSSVSGVTFSDTARSILDLEMAGSSSELLIDDFTFSGNTALTEGLNFVAGGGAGIHQDVSILNNTAVSLQGKYGDPDSVVDRFNFIFDGNVGTKALTHGSELLLAFKGIDGVTVTDNSQPVTAPAQGTSYVLCTNIVESGNSWN